MNEFKLQTFHGAARLTFGQNPEPIASNNQTAAPTVASTTSSVTTAASIAPIRADDVGPDGADNDAKAGISAIADVEAANSVKDKRQGTFKSSPGAKIKVCIIQMGFLLPVLSPIRFWVIV